MNMPLNFGQKVEEKSPDDIIPKGTLLWVNFTVRGFKNSSTTNGRYADIEMTVAEGQPFAKRKIWAMLADINDTNNSQAWRDMAYGAIRRILEATQNAVPADANSYSINGYEDLSGRVVPVLIGIEKGTDGHDDKNTVDYLSPQSSVKKIVKCFELLSQGVHEYGKKEAPKGPQTGNLLAGTQVQTPVAAPPAAGGYAPPPAAAQAAPAYLAPQPAAAPANPPQGQVPAQPQQAQPVTAAVPPQQPQTNTAPPVTPATQSPSEQPAQGWAPPPGANTAAQ